MKRFIIFFYVSKTAKTWRNEGRDHEKSKVSQYNVTWINALWSFFESNWFSVPPNENFIRWNIFNHVVLLLYCYFFFGCVFLRRCFQMYETERKVFVFIFGIFVILVVVKLVWRCPRNLVNINNFTHMGVSKQTDRATDAHELIVSSV